MNLSYFILNVNSNLIDACLKIQSNGCRATAIEKNGALFGVLTEGDIIRASLMVQETFLKFMIMLISLQERFALIRPMSIFNSCKALWRVLP